ncbi:MAG: hypothetical protein KJO43_05905 [Phycisphaerae bacterium]|nr:hypothetical protein [Phycisphaerae bacterium]NNF43842.1 hypothetical protein [Phycisphaerales bacterium]
MTTKPTIHCLGLLVGLGVLASAPVAVGQGVVPVEQRHAFTAGELPMLMDVEINPFDTRGGRYELLNVRMDVFADVLTNLTAENDAAEPAPGFAVVITGFAAARVEDFAAFRLLNRMYFTSGVEASDGIPGSGPDFWDFGRVSAPTHAWRETVAIPSPFTGEDTIDVMVALEAEYHVFGTLLGTVTTGEDLCHGELVVTYNYAVVCPGDVDGDRQVGLTDLLGVLAAWGECEGCDADLDGDGEVGFTDLVSVLGTWGVDCRE